MSLESIKSPVLRSALRKVGAVGPSSDMSWEMSNILKKFAFVPSPQTQQALGQQDPNAQQQDPNAQAQDPNAQQAQEVKPEDIMGAIGQLTQLVQQLPAQIQQLMSQIGPGGKPKKPDINELAQQVQQISQAIGLPPGGAPGGGAPGGDPAAAGAPAPGGAPAGAPPAQ